MIRWKFFVDYTYQRVWMFYHKFKLSTEQFSDSLKIYGFFTFEN